MNKKQIRYALNKVLDIADSVTCEELHHNTTQYHASDERCPVEYHIQRQIHIIRENVLSDYL